MPHDPLTIRPAEPRDVPDILALVRELADYERAPRAVVATEALFRQHLFGPRPAAEVLMAHLGHDLAGFALFFPNFSTWLGRPGLYLEDLFVRPALRGRGVGRALLVRLAGIARERGCGRMEWSVLDWNEPAIGFYEKLGARPQSEWTTWRLDGAALERLAHG